MNNFSHQFWLYIVECVIGYITYQCFVNGKLRKVFNLLHLNLELFTLLFSSRHAPADVGSDRILCGTFSQSGSLFAACDDYKQLTLWKSDQIQWTRQSIRFENQILIKLMPSLYCSILTHILLFSEVDRIVRGQRLLCTFKTEKRYFETLAVL